MECMGVASGCCCKEVYRFHTTYPYSFCICSFFQQHPYFLFIIYIYTVKPEILAAIMFSVLLRLHILAAINIGVL